MTIFSRLAKIGIPVAAAVVAGTVLNTGSRHDVITVQAASFDPSEPMTAQPPFFPSSVFSNSSGAPSSYVNFPRTEWDWNWDNREPSTMVSAKKLKGATTEEERKALFEKAKPVARRNIFLIRHGQYHIDKPTKELTPLGREQAALLGQRLAKCGKKFDVVIMSTMSRAIETARIMMAEMNPVEASSDSLLEEGAPYPPEPPVGHWHPKQHGSRIEAAFRKYIHRASPKQKEDSFEIIVCHANVIRYFVCRALQFAPEGWLRFSLGNASITWLVITPTGQVVVRAIGDIGHLPADKISFS